jgi:hypothetical protein
MTMLLVVARFRIDEVGAPDRPEAGVDVAIGERVGRFVEVQALFVDVVIGDAVGLQDGGGVDLGARSRRADRDALAAQIGERGDAAAFQRHDLDHVGIDRREPADHRQLLALEPAGAGIGLRTVSASASARSASPVAIRPMFSTEAPVTSAVAEKPSTCALMISARPPPIG